MDLLTKSKEIFVDKKETKKLYDFIEEIQTDIQAFTK